MNKCKFSYKKYEKEIKWKVFGNEGQNRERPRLKLNDKQNEFDLGT